MPTIKPTVGRVLWYYPEGRLSVERGDQPFAASIAYVHGDTLINIGYLNECGQHMSTTGVRLLREGEELPTGPFCIWMPYQMGQAAKTEVAEAARRGFEGK